jgi:hypothetical protein
MSSALQFLVLTMARRERQQEWQPAGASHAGGDGVADAALATGLPRPAQMDAGSGRGDAQEGDRPGGPAIGGGSALYGANHRREAGADLPARSGLITGT